MCLLLLVLSCLCSFFNPSTFFLQDITTMVQDGIFIFDIHVNNDKLYCGIENQPSAIFSSLYVLFFLFLHAFNTVIFP